MDCEVYEATNAEDSGTASAGGATTLTDSTKSWPIDGWKNVYEVAIIGGTGTGQRRTIISNTATELTVATWDTNPDATSQYEIWAVTIIPSTHWVYVMGYTAAKSTADGTLTLKDGADNGIGYLSVDTTTLNGAVALHHPLMVRGLKVQGTTGVKAYVYYKVGPKVG